MTWSKRWLLMCRNRNEKKNVSENKIVPPLWVTVYFSITSYSHGCWKGICLSVNLFCFLHEKIKAPIFRWNHSATFMFCLRTVKYAGRRTAHVKLCSVFLEQRVYVWFQYKSAKVDSFSGSQCSHFLKSTHKYWAYRL